MARSAIPKDDGFQECSPAQIIDVIDIDICFQQLPDDLNMPALGGEVQAGALSSPELSASSQPPSMIKGKQAEVTIEFREFGVRLAVGSVVVPLHAAMAERPQILRSLRAVDALAMSACAIALVISGKFWR